MCLVRWGGQGSQGERSREKGAASEWLLLVSTAGGVARDESRN